MKQKLLSKLKRNRKRIIAITVIILLESIPALPAAYNLNELLSKTHNYTFNPLIMLKGLHGITLLLFFGFWLGLILLLVASLVNRATGVDNQSDMFKVTPNISIPYYAGQGQCGTAWFTPRREMGSVFTQAEIDLNDPLLQELIEAGKKDYAEIEKKYANELKKERSKQCE